MSIPNELGAFLDAAEQYATAEMWAGHPLAIILEALVKQTRAALAAESVEDGATDDGDVAIDRWIESRPDWPSNWPAVTQCQLTALVGEALEHWGRPAAPPALDARPVAYLKEWRHPGNNSPFETVRRVDLFAWCQAWLENYNPTITPLFAHPVAPPAPEPESPAGALAARPLLEKVAQLGDCIGQQTVAQVRQLAGQAATWLRDNPPGQPVAIEPRGCPAPGGCSCVEPTPPAPDAGEVEELVDVLLADAECLTAEQPDLTRATNHQITRAATLLQQQEVRIAVLRAALTVCGQAVGSLIQPNCTDSFPLHVPEEVRLAVAKAAAPALAAESVVEVAIPSDELMNQFRQEAQRISMDSDGEIPAPRAMTRLVCAWARRQAAPAPVAVPVAVSERLPEPSIKVLAYYSNSLGEGRTICAIWVPAKTRSDSDGEDDFAEYDEETDRFYWPEGWYEQIENWEDLGWAMVYEGEVVYWQPLPKWPAHAIPLPQGGEVQP